MAVTNNSINSVIIGSASKSAFGEMLVAEPSPVIQISFPYNINTDIVTTSTAGSGTVTQSDSFAVLSTGAAINSTATLQTNDLLHYRPGQGSSCLFTAIFTTGIEGNTQILGIGDTVDGFFFGYNGTSFGILHRNDSSDTWIAQSSWNKDVMDGVGPSVMNLDPTQGNVYKIQYQWLGFGAINFFIEDSNTGEFRLVHQIQYPNANTSTSLVNPSLPIYAQVDNDTNDTDIVLKTPSLCVYIEGENENDALRHAISNRKGSITTELNVLTIRNKTTYASKTNKSRVQPDFISFAVAGTPDCKFSIYLNATLGGSPSYTDVSTNTSVVDYDTAGTTVSSGRALAFVYVNGNQQETVNLADLRLYMNPGDTLTISGQSAGGGGGAITCDVGISWTERI